MHAIFFKFYSGLFLFTPYQFGVSSVAGFQFEVLKDLVVHLWLAENHGVAPLSFFLFFFCGFLSHQESSQEPSFCFLCLVLVFITTFRALKAIFPFSLEISGDLLEYFSTTFQILKKIMDYYQA